MTPEEQRQHDLILSAAAYVRAKAKDPYDKVVLLTALGLPHLDNHPEPTTK